MTSCTCDGGGRGIPRLPARAASRRTCWRWRDGRKPLLTPTGSAWAVSELGQLGRRCQDALYMGAEVDEQCDSLFDTGDCAETVLVVGDLVAYREALGRRPRVGSAERAGGQVAPATGRVRAHCHQYAPARGAQGGPSAWPGSRGRIWAWGGGVGSRFRAGRPASGVEVAQYLRIGGQQACFRVGN